MDCGTNATRLPCSRKLLLSETVHRNTQIVGLPRNLQDCRSAEGQIETLACGTPPNLIHARRRKCARTWMGEASALSTCVARNPIPCSTIARASRADESIRTCVRRHRTSWMSLSPPRSRLCSSLSANRLDGRPSTRIARASTHRRPWAARDSFCLTRSLLVTTLPWFSANWACNLANSSSVSGSMFTSAVCVTE